MIVALSLALVGVVGGQILPTKDELVHVLFLKFNDGMCGETVCNEDPNIVRVSGVKCRSNISEEFVTCRYRRKMNNVLNPLGGTWLSAVTKLERSGTGQWAIVTDTPDEY